MKTHRSYIRLVDGSENEDDRDDDRHGTDDATDGTDGKDASRKEPKRRYGPRKPKAAMSKRRHTDCRKSGYTCKESERQSRACEEIAASVVLVTAV